MWSGIVHKVKVLTTDRRLRLPMECVLPGRSRNSIGTCSQPLLSRSPQHPRIGFEGIDLVYLGVIVMNEVHAKTHAAVKPGGSVIVSTFGPEGPTKCSGLDVVRYDAESLHQEFGVRFRLLDSCKELHQTPFGTVQQFLYCLCRIE